MNMASAINVWETSKNMLSVMLSLACCTDRACMFVIVGPCLTSMFPYMLPTDDMLGKIWLLGCQKECHIL